MVWTVDQIWRYPIKGIGAERMSAVDLAPGRPLPLDRAWAVLEDGGDTGAGWRSCRNFLRGAKGPSLMAVTSEVVGTSLILRHPERPDLTIVPGSPEAASLLFDWLRPIYPETRRPPMEIVEAPSEGMSDAPFASVSVLNRASLRALSQKIGRPLDPRRFRGNLWLEGPALWEEFDLVGKHLIVGDAELEIIEPIGRCRATHANPETGREDVDTLRALDDGWGHTDFGVYARVRRGGAVAQGDAVSIA